MDRIRKFRSTLPLIGLFTLVALLLPSSTVFAAPLTIELISVASDGAIGDDYSYVTDISDDGRYVVFASAATNLVPNDTNGFTDIFLHDRLTGTTELISVATDGTQGNTSVDDATGVAVVSNDGRYVAFDSGADNLVAGDTNGAPDIFLRDRQTGTTTRISVATDGTEANGDSEDMFISADGRYVAFDSGASNLVAGDTNGEFDVFIRDTQNNTTERVSLANDGSEGNNFSFVSAISPDGRYVLFTSNADNLVAGDMTGARDVFLRDLQNNTTVRVNLADDESEGNGASNFATMTPDARFVVFQSFSDNLVTGDTNGASDVFLRDLQNNTTERINVASDGTESDGTTAFRTADISDDGRYVVFYDDATNLIAGGTTNTIHVYRRDRQMSTTELASSTLDGTEGNALSFFPYMSADGSLLAFNSDATNLTLDTLIGSRNVFVVGYSAPPVANDDSGYMATVGEMLTVDALNGVLANDTDTEMATLSAVLDSDVSQGMLTLNSDGSFTYTPDLGAMGSDTFTYFANDGTVNSATAATVTITLTTPDGMPPRLYPVDGATLVTQYDWPQFTFQPMDGIEWYQVWVGLADYSQPAALFEWYPATDDSVGALEGQGICEAGVCTIPTDIWLGNGDHLWWMTYWGPDDQDFNSYWNDTAFNVNFGAPSGTFTLTTPADGSTVNAAPTTIEWARDTAALWYQVWVGPDDYSTSQFFGWVDATEICDDTTCLLDVSDQTFADGDYEVWIEMWGPNGYITWLDVNGGNAAATFTVDTSSS